MICRKVGDIVENKDIIPDHHQMTEFLRGHASKIFDDVAQNDKVVVMIKIIKSQNTIVSLITDIAFIKRMVLAFRRMKYGNNSRCIIPKRV